MSLSNQLVEVSKEVPRHMKAYADAQTRRPALAMHATATALLAALDLSSPLGHEERDALVVALVEEAQATPHPLWQAILLTAFAPMLKRLRRRLGRRGDEDVDQRVLLAFLSAVRAVRPGRYTAMALRWATEKSLFAEEHAARRMPELAPFDEETHPADVFGVDARDDARVAEVVRILEAHASDQLLDVLLATRAGDETLLEYVGRTTGGTERERHAEYLRLCRARVRLVDEVRARFAPSLAA